MTAPDRATAARVPLRVAVDDVHLAVLELGDPSGPPTVLVPGLTDGLAPVEDPRTQALLAEAPLPVERRRTLVVSHRDPAVAPVTTRQLATDLAVVLDRLLDRPAVLLCHSMGAMVAQHLAADRPDLVAAMVLSATVPAADEPFRRRIRTWEALVRDGRHRAFAASALEASYVGEELTRRRTLLAAAPPPAPSPDRVRRHVALSSACVSHDATERLGAIRCPTLVLAGERDPVAPPHHAERLAAAVTGAESTVFEGLAHGFPEQARERFAARVQRFLAAHDR